jgi:hypothetical protein
MYSSGNVISVPRIHDVLQLLEDHPSLVSTLYGIEHFGINYRFVDMQEPAGCKLAQQSTPGVSFYRTAAYCEG